jgi:aminopeptidase N
LRSALTCLYLLLHTALLAQQSGIEACKSSRQTSAHQAAKITIATPEEDDYDVQYVKFDLFLSRTSAYIQGNVTTTAKVVAAQMPVYAFELSDTMAIDSVKINGSLTAYDTSRGVCRINMVIPLVAGTVFTAQVYYRGFPRFPDGINVPGFHNYMGVTFSSVEPYFANSWWPCKQSLTDKIDSVDMWVTVLPFVKVGSNGILAAINPVDTYFYRYEWKERYPIDYYLISVSLGNYEDYSYYMHFTGSNDSMLIMNYIDPTLPAYVKPMLDSVGMIVDYFSTIFGRYPFWKEKYGHCYTPSYVNMENQTMTSTHLSHLTVLAHELTHQWFGDNVTCGTWKDIWLNEGFAAYGQYLCYDKFNGHDAALNYMHTVHTDVMADSTGTVYCIDTVDWERIFDARLTYEKGGSALHMLRFVVNNDSLFFNILQTYQRQYTGKTATTDDLKHLVAAIYGHNLDSFFNQWIYSEGYPIVDAAWNQVNDVAYIRISQSCAMPPGTFLFATPMEVKLYSAQGDTTVRVYVNQYTQTFPVITGKLIDSIAIDPNEWLLCKLKQAPVKDTSLNLLPYPGMVYPNPATNTIYVAWKDLQDPYIAIYNTAGRKMSEHKLQWPSGIETVDIQRLPKGVYLYRIVSGGRTKGEGKFVKE